MRGLRLAVCAWILGLAAAGAPVRAQVAAQVTAEVADRIGLLLAEALAQWLEDEPYFAPADPARPHVEIQLATIDPSADRDGAMTVYSAVINWHHEPDALPWFIGHIVGTCTAGRVAACAASIGGDLRLQSERIKRAVRESRRSREAMPTDEPIF